MTGPRDEQRRIDDVCRGWSDGRQWQFFQHLVETHKIREICILGVYYGRDTSYLSHQMHSRGITDYSIVGVDKFSDTPCDDWPDEARHGTWEDAGFGPAPSIDAARANLRTLGYDANVELVASDAATYLAQTSRRFDFIYVDTSHDLVTTRQHIRLALAALKPGGWIGGDDFSDHGTWGVETAVREAFDPFDVFDDWIWLASGANAIHAAPVTS